ncbi:hypothetical protein K438DRAFT_2016253 [Mycena galopus ATCC 62051]|nr:hypothetical protein K438DRAFT_2016253 [Mycena galopus ATCC 62051]
MERVDNTFSIRAKILPVRPPTSPAAGLVSAGPSYFLDWILRASADPRSTAATQRPMLVFTNGGYRAYCLHRSASPIRPARSSSSGLRKSAGVAMVVHRHLFCVLSMLLLPTSPAPSYYAFTEPRFRSIRATGFSRSRNVGGRLPVLHKVWEDRLHHGFVLFILVLVLIFASHAPDIRVPVRNVTIPTSSAAIRALIGGRWKEDGTGEDNGRWTNQKTELGLFTVPRSGGDPALLARARCNRGCRRRMGARCPQE